MVWNEPKRNENLLFVIVSVSVLDIVFFVSGGVLRIGELRQAAREVGAVDVPHLGPLRLEVLLVLLGDRGHHRHPPHHGEAVALEPDELGRVVGHQPHRAHADVTEYLEQAFGLKSFIHFNFV